jgi:hypothetical protein
MQVQAHIQLTQNAGKFEDIELSMKAAEGTLTSGCIEVRAGKLAAGNAPTNPLGRLCMHRP